MSYNVYLINRCFQYRYPGWKLTAGTMANKPTMDMVPCIARDGTPWVGPKEFMDNRGGLEEARQRPEYQAYFT